MSSNERCPFLDDPSNLWKTHIHQSNLGLESWESCSCKNDQTMSWDMLGPKPFLSFQMQSYKLRCETKPTDCTAQLLVLSFFTCSSCSAGLPWANLAIETFRGTKSKVQMAHTFGKKHETWKFFIDFYRLLSSQVACWMSANLAKHTWKTRPYSLELPNEQRFDVKPHTTSYNHFDRFIPQNVYYKSV